jgi:hypothetical protein
VDIVFHGEGHYDTVPENTTHVHYGCWNFIIRTQQTIFIEYFTLGILDKYLQITKIIPRKGCTVFSVAFAGRPGKETATIS